MGALHFMGNFAHFFSDRVLFQRRDDVDFLFAGALVVFHEKTAQSIGGNPHVAAVLARAKSAMAGIDELLALENQKIQIHAMDAFGGLYVSIGEDMSSTVKIDPETAEMTKQFTSQRECAEAIESAARVETGWPLWLEWGNLHGVTEWPVRLVPIVPFVLGGTFDTQNMEAKGF